MVVIRGQSSRAAVWACGTSFLTLLALVVILLVVYRAPIFSHEGFRLLGELRKPIALGIATTIVIAFLVGFLTCLLAAWRFAKLNPHVIITHEGIQFPGIPSFRWTRWIDWSDVRRVSLLTEDSYPNGYKALFRISNWTYGYPVLLKIDLCRWKQRAGLRGLKDWLEGLIQSTMVGPNALLEAVFTDGLSPKQTVTAISAMFQDTAIRAKYGGDGTTYIVRPGIGDDVRFELD